MTATTTDAHAPEAVQPELDLPDHHGRKPAGMRSKLNGAGNRIARSHEIGDRVYLFVEATVKDAGHTKTAKDGLLYVEKLGVDDFYEVDGEAGGGLVAGFRQQYRMADDLRAGRKALFGDEPRAVTPKLVWADETGYILDEADLARLRGEEVEASDEQLAAAEDREAHEQLVAPQWLRAVEDGDTGGYDRLTAAQVIAAVKVVDERSVIIACAKHESSDKNRATVRKALESRLTELSEPSAD